MGGVILILLDSLMNFRLEYLYPVLMFMHSVYDSYKYQGFVSPVAEIPINLNALLSPPLDTFPLDFFSSFHLTGGILGPSLLDGPDSALAIRGRQHLCVAYDHQNIR